jgi:hypothetical protein
VHSVAGGMRESSCHMLNIRNRIAIGDIETNGTKAQKQFVSIKPDTKKQQLLKAHIPQCSEIKRTVKQESSPGIWLFPLSVSQYRRSNTLNQI